MLAQISISEHGENSIQKHLFIIYIYTYIYAQFKGSTTCILCRQSQNAQNGGFQIYLFQHCKALIKNFSSYNSNELFFL